MGLRHGVDADHIAAIDNVTRKLIQNGRRYATSMRDARGRGENQFTEDEIVEKFAGLVRDRYSQTKIDQIVQTIFALDTMADVSSLMDLLRFEN